MRSGIYLAPQEALFTADRELLQKQRSADVVGFYGGLASTIPRLFDLARFYKSSGAITVAGGQHLVDETIPEALSSDIDLIALGEGEEIIQELLRAFTRGDEGRTGVARGHVKNQSRDGWIYK